MCGIDQVVTVYLVFVQICPEDSQIG